MECVIITRQSNLAQVDAMGMDKKDVKHVKSLFTMKEYFAHAVTRDYVIPHDTQN